MYWSTNRHRFFYRYVVQHEPPFQSGDVTCDDLDEFPCADGRECILKGTISVLASMVWNVIVIYILLYLLRYGTFLTENILQILGLEIYETVSKMKL